MKGGLLRTSSLNQKMWAPDKIMGGRKYRQSEPLKHWTPKFWLREVLVTRNHRKQLRVCTKRQGIQSLAWLNSRGKMRKGLGEGRHEHKVVRVIRSVGWIF